MKIKDIISINSQAVLSNAIQLAWYGDPSRQVENDRLASGYVFGNGVDLRTGNRTEISSLPVFERIRDAFGNPSANNIFTIIANYGHGKSHFALVLANFFGLKPDSPALKEIISHIEICSDKVTADQFRHFKQQTKKSQLVVTLSGNQFQDLRQGFLQALRRALDAHEMTRNRPIKSIYEKAVEWLNSLNEESVGKANEYLEQKYQIDVDALTAALEGFESDKEFIVKDLSRELNGIEANFGASVSLKEIIDSTIDELCTGADAPFHKMLILFDELGIYTQLWCHHSIAAGNFAPQEIFEACSDRPGKVCFVGFAQRDLNSFVQGYSLQVQNEFKKWAGRMPTESTYHLISNLEQVIGKIIVKQDKWKLTIKDNSPQISDESGMVWETIPRYKDTWERNNFYLTVARDCYPLHPFTTGLLCGFDFTQGSRTIIGAVNSMLSAAEDQDISISGRLNWIRPIELVKQFEIDFKKDSSEYSSYEYAVNALGRDEEPILFHVLQALFLFNEGKLNKQNKYDHALILSHLAGYSEPETRSALEKLRESYDAIRFSAQKREYEFTGVGSSRLVVLESARREIAGKKVDSLVRSLEKLKAFETVTLHPSEAREFKSDFSIQGDEWYLAPSFVDAGKFDAGIIKKLSIENHNEGDARGTVIYALATNALELEQARDRAESVLDELRKDNFPDPVVIAVPKEPATQLEKQILTKDFLVNMSTHLKSQFGDSHRAAIEHTNKELTEQLIAHIRSVDFFVPSELRLKIGLRDKNLEELSDALFADTFRFRPPANSNIMKPSGAKGNSVTAEIARQLIVNDLNLEGLTSDKQNVVKSVLSEGTNSWGIIDANSRIREPKHLGVLEAWNLLRKSVSENQWTTFASILNKLMQAPYGYDNYTATFLIAAWIGKHKHELGFKDNKKQLSSYNASQANLTLGDLQNNLNKSKDFIKWLRSNVSVQQSGRANKRRAQEFFERLKAPKDANESTELLTQVESILQMLPPEDDLIEQIRTEAHELTARVHIADLEAKRLEEFRTAASLANDVPRILRVRELLSNFGAENSMQASAAFVGLGRFIEERLKGIATEESKATLPRIESYDSVHGNLERSRKALNKVGRSDLEGMFVEAIKRVQQDYERLITEKAEAPLIAEITSIQVGPGVPLNFYRQGKARIEDILRGTVSARVKEIAESKRKGIDEQINLLLRWTSDLAQRTTGVQSITEARAIQTEILRRESLYGESLEANVVSESLAAVAARLKELESEEQNKEKAEREHRLREQEKHLTENISLQFNKLSDPDKRFECLVEILQAARDNGLTDEQKRILMDLLK